VAISVSVASSSSVTKFVLDPHELIADKAA
jgi:hypothetical protein